MPDPDAAGFTPGAVYWMAASTTNPSVDAVYNPNGTIFVDNLPANITNYQNMLFFDTVGSFGGAMIVFADNEIHVYKTVDGSAVQINQYSQDDPNYVLQSRTIAPYTTMILPKLRLNNARLHFRHGHAE